MMWVFLPIYRIRLCCAVGAALACIVSNGQATWRRTYGGLGIDEARSIRQTSDGGYIVAGSTGSFGNGASDIYVLRLDEYGEPIWSRFFGGMGIDTGVSCRELSDGYAIAGTSSMGANGSYDLVLIKTDLQGDLIWEKSYGTADWDLCNALCVTADGFALAGISYGGGAPNGTAYVVRTDQNGDTLWTRALGGAYRTECNDIIAIPGQGFVIAGSIATEAGPDDGFLAKLDLNGGQLWFTPIGGESSDAFSSVAQMGNGDLVACGTSFSGSDVSRIYLAGVGPGGQFLWEQFIGNTADAGGAEICARNGDSGFVFTGYNTLNAGAKDMILTTIDQNGYFQFGNNYGDGHPAEGLSIETTMDGGYVVAGWAEGYGPGLRAMYVVKSDSLGQTSDLAVTPYADPLPVNELPPPDQLGIFPNMVHAGERIQLTGTLSGKATVQLVSMYGSVIMQLALMNVEGAAIQVPALAPGLYHLKLLQGDGSVWATKLVVVD